MEITKPTLLDLPSIKNILSQWTDPSEVEKYSQRIIDEISGHTQFNMHFWVIKELGKVIGVGGLADILPWIKQYSQTDSPVELKILYLDNKERGRGAGKIFLDTLESEARKMNKKEMLIRTAKKYQDTAWGFYEKMGYQQCGVLPSNNDSEEMAVFRKTL